MAAIEKKKIFICFPNLLLESLGLFVLGYNIIFGKTFSWLEINNVI